MLVSHLTVLEEIITRITNQLLHAAHDITTTGDQVVDVAWFHFSICSSVEEWKTYIERLNH